MYFSRLAIFTIIKICLNCWTFSAFKCYQLPKKKVYPQTFLSRLLNIHNVQRCPQDVLKASCFYWVCKTLFEWLGERLLMEAGNNMSSHH